MIINSEEIKKKIKRPDNTQTQSDHEQANDELNTIEDDERVVNLK